MSISESYTERLERDLRAITEPLMQQLKDIDGEIEGMTKELSELRAHRTKLVTIARQIDPELAPVKKVQSKAGPTVSDKMVGEVLDWLKEHRAEIDFHASGLMANGYDVTSASQLSKALGVLHDRGLIRLDHMGKGGAKFYRVVT